MLRKKKRPWDVDSPDVRKAMMLRLSRRTLAQVRYIAEREDRSQQKVIERILLPAIEHQAEELWIRE